MGVKKVQRPEQVREIVRCGKDPIYFINKYCKIRHPKRGIIDFKTYPFQDDCLRAFKENRKNIVLKARQLGLSTVTAAYALWLALFYKDKTIIVIATKGSTAGMFIKKNIKVMLDYLPAWLIMPEYTVTNGEIRFDNGSSITAITTGQDAGRGTSPSLLICDEAAWIPKMDEIWTGLAPTLAEGGNVILLSTPNGMIGTGGTFYQLYTQATTGLNDFNPIRLPWEVHPEHDQAWFDKETSNMPRKKVAQEYTCSFLLSGDTFLEPDEIEHLRVTVESPIIKEGIQTAVWIWKKPEPGRRYVLSADVSRGNARDYSTFHVIDVDACDVVAEYMGKIPPEKFTDVIIEYGYMYNTALLVIELNSFGYTVNVGVKDKKYPRIFYEKNGGNPFSYTPPDDGQIYTAGFNTNGAVRLPMLTKLGELVRTKKLKIRSQRFYDQIQGFMWIGNKPQAAKDNFDDLVMSLAIGCWLVETATVEDDNQTEMIKAMLRATTVVKNEASNMPRMGEVYPLIPASMMNGQTAMRAHHVENLNKRAVGRYRELTNFNWLYG